MKELVETIVKALVDSPDDVDIHETAGESVVILEIRVAQADVGKVIGKDGRIANAIRTVVKASAAKNDKKVTVEILTKQYAGAQKSPPPAQTFAANAWVKGVGPCEPGVLEST